MENGQLPVQPIGDAVSPKHGDENIGDEIPPTAIPPSTETKPPESHQNETRTCRPDQTPWWKHLMELTAIVVGLCALIIYWRELRTMAGQLTELQNSNKISRDALQVGNRPWVKITPRIVEPLTFNVMRNAGSVATMTTENFLENVGPSVAVNVLSWEDVIPVDPDGSLKTARARQQQWCGAHRFIQKGEMTGSVLFPHDPRVEKMGMGQLMTKVNEAAAKNTLLPGKAAFVLVGCVSYRSTFEPQNAPSHQTRFIYWLGIPTNWGGFQPNIVPIGVASQLRLIEMPDGFTAD